MSSPTIEHPDEVRLRARLSSLAAAMDLAPEARDNRARDQVEPARPHRRSAVLAVAAAVLIVVAVAVIGTSHPDDRVELSTGAWPVPVAPRSVDSAPPATGDQVSSIPLAPSVPSSGFDLSDTGVWPGPGDVAAPRATPEEAVRSYLAAILGSEAEAASTLQRWPVVTVDGGVTITATLPSGQAVTLSSYQQADGWTADSFGIGGTSSSPTAVPGDAPDTATEVGVPVVDGAVAGRLWYRSSGATWQMELGPQVMGHITPAIAGLPGHEPSIHILIPTSTPQLDGVVLVYLDADGNPITLHSASGLACCAPDGGS